MNWIPLSTEAQLKEIDELSNRQAVLIFKHSTTCSISSASLGRMERNWKAEVGTLAPYFLDLLRHRSLSQAVALHYGVQHESPQVLLIRGGKCVYHTSHMDISYMELMGQLEALDTTPA